MVTENCSWYQGKALNDLCGDLSLTLMGKTHKSSREYTSGFVPGDRHAVEAVGESDGFASHGHARSEDSCVRKRRCISLNDDKSGGFFVPIQVISFSEMSSSERKNLEVRFRRELELVQKFQKKILSRPTLKPNGVIVSAACDDPLVKLDRAGQNITQLKRGIGGRIESMKQVSSPPSTTVLMKQCETLLKRLMAHQYAWVFNTPVDVVKLNIPDYFTVIKQPMDLGTVKSKVASGAYSNPQDFASDVRLTFANAMTYNPPTNDVHAMANVMRNFFESRWKPIEKKLAAADMAIKRETKAVKSASESLKRKIPPVDHPTVVLDSEPRMTDEEKLHLSRRLSSIPELPQHIVDFLKRYTDDADQDSDGEIEIDFDSLSIEALFQLKKLLDDYVQGNNLNQLKKTETCEMEILIESGLSTSSLRPCKGNGPADVVEYLDICGNEPPITSYSLADRDKRLPRSSCGSGSSSSSSESGSSSSDSDSCSTLRSESNMKAARTTNPKKENERLEGPPLRHEEGPLIEVDQAEQNAHRNAVPVTSNVSPEGENAPSERQVSPDKLYRVALLRSRFADTIFKAREKTLDKGEKRDPEKLKQEREELERQQREERARLQAEAKAAEDARLKAEAEAAAEAKRRLELEREAARQALLQMEKTVEINENSLFFKDLEMLRTAPMANIPGSAIDINPDCSNGDIDCFKFSGSNPLEQLGLFIKDDFDDVDDEGEPDRPVVRAPLNDFEEGEID